MEDTTLTASEAVYGFAAWLSTRDKEITIGRTHECSTLAELCGKFVKANGLAAPRDGIYPHNIKCLSYLG